MSYIGSSPTQNSSSYSGYHSLKTSYDARLTDTWPLSPSADWEYVKLRLTMDGTNGSTTFTDLSDSGHTVTAQGNAQVTTATKKFGTGGLLLDGTGDYLTIPDSADWDVGSGPFTIDCWVKPDSWPATGGDPVFIIDYGWNNGSSISFAFGNGSDIRCDIGGTSPTFVGTGALSLSTTEFTHIRLTWGGSGTAWRIIVDGTEEASTTVTGTVNSVTGDIAIGARATGSQALAGVIDDVRIVVGSEASDTPPPTSALPTA